MEYLTVKHFHLQNTCPGGRRRFTFRISAQVIHVASPSEYLPMWSTSLHLQNICPGGRRRFTFRIPAQVVDVASPSEYLPRQSQSLVFYYMKYQQQPLYQIHDKIQFYQQGCHIVYIIYSAYFYVRNRLPFYFKLYYDNIKYTKVSVHPHFWCNKSLLHVIFIYRIEGVNN